MDDLAPDTVPGIAVPRLRRRALLAAALLATVPSRVAQATTSRTTIESLLTLPIVSPDAPYPWFGIERMTLEPTAVEPYGQAESHGVGDIGFVVDRGEISFETDGPATVARKGGNVLANGIPVAAGSVTRLLPGDQAVTASGVVSRRRNSGATQAATYELSATDVGAIMTNHDGIQFTVPCAETFPRRFADGSSANLAFASLVRVFLPPDAQIRLRDVPHAELLAVVHGHVDVYGGGNPLVSSGLSIPPKRMLRLMPGFGMPSLSTQVHPATIFRCGSDQPATMLVATLAPASAAPARLASSP